MHIQWYPGHMHKARKQIKETLPKVDIIIEVLDARIPFSSQNPLLNSLRGDKPCIKVLNKSDLADALISKIWQEYLEQQRNIKTIALSSSQPDKMRKIIDLCHKIVPEKAKSDRGIHAMIVGIPNVGKSTLINILAKRIIAKTGNEPAITKTQQVIKIDHNITLLDTPGMLWPKIENENSSYRLATTGAIKDTAIDHTDIAFFAADFLLQHYPEQLQKRYQFDTIPKNELELLEYIGRQRGCLRSGGQVELNQVSSIFLNELRNGTLGNITLETPDVITQELLKVEQIKKDSIDKKALRKSNFKKRTRT
ncbi:LSU ribosomal maturation GTPase RbgA (B. subtilis YlqF) [hydrothermal vent metagenome]|uniref:LSU ribosomal maturation GTPase RbgA (B. subtilis YlqF) n=1 Tax=hydrothermal vent metagenome TaxID=652676 RepID=A0A3B0ZY15_9ZZZZ